MVVTAGDNDSLVWADELSVYVWTEQKTWNIFKLHIHEKSISILEDSIENR